MATWQDFVEEAPRVSEIFQRRHAATGNLCLLATVRADGSPRISPIEPRVFEGRLLLVGMPHTTKFADLARDGRFCLHTATADPHVGDGDVKLFGAVRNDQDRALHQRFADALFAENGFDLRGQEFDPFYVAELSSASSVTIDDGELTITIWKPGQGERVVRKS
ncbi:Pyridoxamine 5'-phosphate oxidase [Asanoa ishikariensis]|uniref:Pyridoxamine 5'-phosphate oxidase n=1 Tax=Asanoa ishikariensis TaxID=137265 RepID=A0A1H3RVZ8_9ACTN|nr:pyridoxamine 5'-phosphate oxidase family protein [Asanoa ishikariensis]SDZ29893.1 Pyridoxamine 5'-phosphate oxidase [Asanoa ishikariensis]